MKQGFWTDLEKMQKDTPEADWGFLENELFAYGVNLYDFLHGRCAYFAQYLHDTYGYKIVGLYEEPDQLIHAYCVEVIDGISYYIDVRGITDNWAEFIQEFYDTGCWCGDYSYSYYLTDNDVVSKEDAEGIKKESPYNNPYKAAAVIDDKYKYYNLRTYLKGDYCAA